MLLSRNYPPSEALAPYLRRHYVFAAELSADFELIDQLLSETAFIRILLDRDWAAETSPGLWRFVGPTPLFGANFQPCACAYEGLSGWSVSLRPSGWPALFPCSARLLSDQIVPLENHWGALAGTLHDTVVHAQRDAEVVAAIEAVVAARLEEMRSGTVHAAMARFEGIARADSMALVNDVARELDVSVRHLERLCYDCFGHRPKAVLRRSCFLDMAQAMRGFSTPSDEEFAGLRYYDQSHRNREFQHFVRMTSRAFEAASTPLLTAGLKLRAEGVS